MATRFSHQAPFVLIQELQTLLEVMVWPDGADENSTSDAHTSIAPKTRLKAVLHALGQNDLPEPLQRWANRISAALAGRDPSSPKLQALAAQGLRLCAQWTADHAPAPRRREKNKQRPTAMAFAAAQPPRSSVGPHRNTIRPQDSPAVLKGCGPKLAEKLSRKSLDTVADLALFIPCAYQDRRVCTPLGALTPGTWATVEATVDRSLLTGPPWKRKLEVHIKDDSGTLVLVWFRIPRGYNQKFKAGDPIRASGRVTVYRKRLQIAHPEMEKWDDPQIAIVARYPIVEGLGPKKIRFLCRQAAVAVGPQMDDGIPAAVTAPLGLPTLTEALMFLHQVPDTLAEDETRALQAGVHPAQKRFTFTSLFFTQLALARQRRRWSRLNAFSCGPPENGIGALEETFGFTLTEAQKRVINEIRTDLRASHPMQRLLQGDVGSGKTVVALAATHQVLEAGHQVALMAPTEILARQHLETLKPYLKRFGFPALLLTAQTPAPARRSVTAALEGSTPMLVVGTHALIAESVHFGKLGLAVIDEQHRFGVAQRRRLHDKALASASAPHILVMTATPIPRSLALTAYGDLDLSVIDELPPDRHPTHTRLYTTKQKKQAWQDLAELLESGHQAYVVCPLISPSDKIALADAERTAQKLKKTLGPKRVGLLHGQMTTEEKQRALNSFRDGRTQILVSTTVIEVGVDVPSAAVMVVIDAERFGLSQLHQLRGRVGRSATSKGHCLLLAGKSCSSQSLERLQVLTRTADGFAIAEADLENRGPGDLSGIRQAGLPSVELKTLVADPLLLAEARRAAQDVVARDPELEAPQHATLRNVLDKRASSIFGGEAG
jgi:ATP-dependent DNA helicase RecG